MLYAFRIPFILLVTSVFLSARCVSQEMNSVATPTGAVPIAIVGANDRRQWQPTD